MVCEKKIQISNNLSELATLELAAAEFLESTPLTPKASYTATLALEEMCSNIIKYGYDDEKQHEISITLCLNGNDFLITIIDDGHEFNPLKAEIKDFSDEISERKIGGVGIHLTKTMSDKVSYTRKDGKNILEILIKADKT